MKKLILALSVLSVTGVAANAQLRFAPVAGATFSSPATKGDMLDKKMAPGFYVGGLLDYSISRYFSIQAGLDLAMKGYHGKGNELGFDMDEKVNPFYIELPVNAVGKLPVGDGNIFLAVGPYVGYGIAGKIKITSSAPGEDMDEKIKWGSDKNKDNMKPFDFGMNIGAGYEFGNGLFANIGYQAGLINTIPGGNSDFSYKTGVIKLGLGFFF